MHRQAMLVSLSLSPASTAAKNDKHWAFLAEIDAPQWADLKAEEALAGTIGDDPWFYRSHLHHEVPLTDLTGGQSANGKDAKASVRTPQIERKKRVSSKTKLSFETHPVATSHKGAREELNDDSPKASFNSGSQETFAESPSDQISSPILCKSPERFTSSRRFISSTPPYDEMGGNDAVGVSYGPNSREDIHTNQHANGHVSVGACIPVSSSSSSGQSAVVSGDGDGDRPAPLSVPWHESIFPRLDDMRRLRKSLGSALRVRIDDSPESNCTGRQAAGTHPKSRLVHQSVQLETPQISEASRFGTGATSWPNENGESKGSSESDSVGSDSTHSGPGLASRLGTNSSVHAFDDIRRMRKSWGSALRVKISDDPVVDECGPKHEAPEAPAISEKSIDAAAGPVSSPPDECMVDSPSFQLDKMVLDSQGSLDVKGDSINDPEVNKVLDNKALAMELGSECTTHNGIERREEADVVTSLELYSPKVVAAGPSKKYRRSISFDQVQGRIADNVFLSTTQSNSVQQRHSSRATPSAHSQGIVDRFNKVNRTSKGGKENTGVQAPSKLKPSIGPLEATAKKSRQSVMRMSMPSLTFSAHARAANGANGGLPLKASSNGVGDVSKAVASKAATTGARKSVGGLDNGPQKKKSVAAATVTDVPSKMTTRQSTLRSSMPAFSAAALKQGSKPVQETGSATGHGEKKAGKAANGGDDLAALIAEHNRKFRPKPKYEPRIHSVKDIKEWEMRTGKLFYDLQPTDRERANQEITAAKQMLRH